MKKSIYKAVLALFLSTSFFPLNGDETTGQEEGHELDLEDVAETQAPSQTKSQPPTAKKKTKTMPRDGLGLILATGFGVGWQIRRDYGASDSLRFFYELPTYAYLNLYEDVYVRPALRLLYSNSQPEMPAGIKLSETDLGLLAEVGAVWDSYVIPSLSLGYGQIQRVIRLETGGDIDRRAFPSKRRENLNIFTVQLGVGIPALSGLLVLEPYVRYFDLEYDDRGHWSYGFETTITLYQ